MVATVNHLAPTQFLTSFIPSQSPNNVSYSIIHRSAASPPKSAAAAEHSVPLDCVVIGGGISGLSVAHSLSTNHAIPNFILTESTHRVGGNIVTVEKDGFLWEEGPNSFQPSDPILSLLVECGLKDMKLC